MNPWTYPRSVPAWYQDAKFGLFFHWGPYTVPAHDNEWYSRQMYDRDHENNAFHRQTYGSPATFGYKDFIPLFTGERFDPSSWADLVELSGARYAGPVSEHADNFSLWDCSINPVNSFRMGPHRDIVGECFAEFRKRGIRCLATFHHQWNWGWFMGTDPDADVYLPGNEAYYGPILPHSAGERMPDILPTERFHEIWRDKVLEVVEKYNPDIVYFDSRANLIPDPYKQSVAEHIYRNKEAVITCKEGDFPKGVGILDIEVRRFPGLQDFYWQEDDKLEAGFTWSYVEGGSYKTAGRIVHELCDIVSKNGNLLLNIGPKADGSFPPEAVTVLKEVGDWLRVNGEAIYGTRPWRVCQEGPTDIMEGYYIHREDAGPGFVLEHTVPDLTGQDIRYTARADILYAIVMGVPEGGSILLTAFTGEEKEQIRRITLLGSPEPVSWQRQPGGIRIFFPETLPCQPAYAFRIH